MDPLKKLDRWSDQKGEWTYYVEKEVSGHDKHLAIYIFFHSSVSFWNVHLIYIYSHTLRDRTRATFSESQDWEEEGQGIEIDMDEPFEGWLIHQNRKWHYKYISPFSSPHQTLFIIEHGWIQKIGVCTHSTPQFGQAMSLQLPKLEDFHHLWHQYQQQLPRPLSFWKGLDTPKARASIRHQAFLTKSTHPWPNAWQNWMRPNSYWWNQRLKVLS